MTQSTPTARPAAGICGRAPLRPTAELSISSIDQFYWSVRPVELAHRSIRFAISRLRWLEARHNPVNGPTKPASHTDPLRFEIHRFCKVLNGLHAYSRPASIVHLLKVIPQLKFGDNTRRDAAFND